MLQFAPSCIRATAVARAILISAVALAVVALGPARAESQSATQTALPPDTIFTVADGDTIPGFGAVGGVAVDGLGYVYHANFRNDVWRYSPGGSIERYATGMYGASGLAVGRYGELYQSSFTGHFITRIERDGRTQVYARDGLNGPVGIALGDNGDLVVVNCTGNFVARVDTTGRVTPLASGALFACPNGITRDDRGDFYVVNFGNTKIVRVTAAGEASEFTDLPGAGGNAHIAFARDGFYVTKYRAHQVFRVERSGAARVLAGTGEQGHSDGVATSAQLSQPNGIAVGAGGTELWINELRSGNGVGGGVAHSVLRRIRLVTLGDVLAQARQAGTPIMAAYERYRRERPDENTSADAITFAYTLLNPTTGADAVALFEANARDYPEDATSQYQLGEAYRFTGQPERAVVQYREVLRIEPGHAGASARIEGLRPGRFRTTAR